MMLGIGLTLGAVAALAVIGRNTFAIMLTRYGASVAAVARGLDGVAGVLLIAFGLREMLR
jgi:hypothetical protein